MINARFMYLRPGNLLKSFVIERGKGGLKMVAQLCSMTGTERSS